MKQAANCNKCRYKGNKLYTVCGCTLYACSACGAVPFWTNNTDLLNSVDCGKYAEIGQPLQLSLFD